MNPTLPRAALTWTALVASETLAQVCLKIGGRSMPDDPFTGSWISAALGNPWVLVGVIGYCGSFIAWMMILDRMSLNLGFPLTSAVVVAVALASAVFLDEPLTPLRVAGIAVIVGGVVVIGSEET
jgi:drug/metabolite transporter (DMT)-like permease